MNSNPLLKDPTEIKQIGKTLSDFRRDYLLLRQEDVEAITGVNQRTLSSFENGRTKNILHLNTYLSLCRNQDELDEFHRVLISLFTKEV